MAQVFHAFTLYPSSNDWIAPGATVGIFHVAANSRSTLGRHNRTHRINPA